MLRKYAISGTSTDIRSSATGATLPMRDGQFNVAADARLGRSPA
jgi:hypothetical protein